MSRSRIAPAVFVVAFALASCGGEDGTTGTGTGSDGMTLTITSPEDDAEVDVPFTLDLDSSEPLGPTESGEHHVHVFFDGDDSEYMVVESDSVEITDLGDGEHVINASLRNADHSAAGVETEISVVVGEGGSGTTDNGGYGY